MPDPSSCLLRPMVLADLAAVLAIQRACYGDGFLEGQAVLAQRLASPVGLSCVAASAGQVRAYLAAYRSSAGKLTTLHGPFEATARPDTLYLHDLAVHPQAAGQGLALALLRHLWALGAAQGLRCSALVAVQGAQVFWQRQGYQEQALTEPDARTRLASYGAGASYMVRPTLAP